MKEIYLYEYHEVSCELADLQVSWEFVPYSLAAFTVKSHIIYPYMLIILVKLLDTNWAKLPPSKFGAS